MLEFNSLWFLLVLIFICSDAAGLNRLARPRSCSLNMAIPGVADVAISPQLMTDLRKYLAEREQSPLEYVAAGSYSAGQMEMMSRAASKEGQGFDMTALEQTGWYRDEEEIARTKTYDASIPIVAHPLSFIELEKYGYERLSDQIVNLGGPFIAAAAIGFEWEEPKFITVWDENLRPVRTKTFNLDMSGSLGLGGSLEDKLSAAADMDMQKLKEAADKKARGVGQGEYSSSSSSSFSYSDTNGPGVRDYKEDFSKVTPAWKGTGEQEQGLKNPFANINRSSFLAVTVLLALGFGRTTAELITTYQLGPSELLIVKGVCSAASIFAGTKIMKNKEQDAASV